MAQQVAAREQLDQLLGVTLATLLNEFAKTRRVADGSALLLEIAGKHAIDDRADGETAADERPSGADAEALVVKLDCPVEGKFNRERADQSARSKSENAAEQAFGDRDIETERHPDHRRGSGCEPKQRCENNLWHQQKSPLEASLSPPSWAPRGCPLKIRMRRSVPRGPPFGALLRFVHLERDRASISGAFRRLL